LGEREPPLLPCNGVIEYLKNGGKFEVAQLMANYESARTTGLYDQVRLAPASS